MSTIFPIPRHYRDSGDLLAEQGQTIFGPVQFILFDALDAVVLVKPAAGEDYATAGGYSIVPAVSLPGFFSVVFAQGRDAGDRVRVLGRRLHARLGNVTQGGAIRGAELEKELDRQSAVLQELRRDADLAMPDLSAAAFADQANQARSETEALRDEVLQLKADTDALKEAAETAANAAAQVIGIVALTVVPGGRVTPTTGVDIVVTSVTGASSIFYAPCQHNRVAVKVGDDWQVLSFSELSQALSDNLKSPSAAEPSKEYYKFLWWDEEDEALRCTRGPAWPGTSGPGSGEGTSELIRVDGIWCNRYAIANGPAAGKGRLAGMIATNVAGTVDMMVGTHAAEGGADNRLLVWNYDNRRRMSTLNRERAAEWSYNTATIRPKNNSVANSVTLISGLSLDAIDCFSSIRCDHVDAASSRIGIGLDSTDTFSPLSRVQEFANTGSDISGTAWLQAVIPLGRRKLTALERGGGGGTQLWRDQIDTDPGTPSPRHLQGIGVTAWM